jgi:NAD+ kinase
MFQTIGLIAKHGDPRVVAAVDRLVAFLVERRVAIVYDAESVSGASATDVPRVERSELGRRCDLVVVVGGDGTFLSAARTLVDQAVPMVGVNLGRLGFLTDINPAEMTERFGRILAGDFVEETRALLTAAMVRRGRTVLEVDALNEVVVHKANIARLMQFETTIDGSLVNRQRSDGLIIATPTGSTAYALSGGGPIVHAGLDALLLVPICPHTLSLRPLVVPGESRVVITLIGGVDLDARFTCDGQTLEELAPGDRLEVRRKPTRLRLIHPPDHDYYATLRTKLHWGREL